MFKITRFSILVLVLFFSFSFIVNADNYLGGVLFRAKDDIKVYLVSDNTRRWISSIEVFNVNNFKWQNVKIVSKKEIAAIKEGSPIILETISPSPASSVAPTSTIIVFPSVSPTPPIPARASPEVSAGQAKINPQFPSPDYVRADWLISYATLNYGRIGQRIVFKYSNKAADKIENFRLYEKKPGDAYFVRIATFEEVSSTGCEDIDIDGEWMITEAGQCGYWSIQRIVPPGGRGATAYLPAASYLEGEYRYYVAGADKDGLETKPSPETKLVFLDPVDILSPADGQSIKPPPIFKWNIASGWPVSLLDGSAPPVPDYFIYISDNKVSQNPLWAKQIKVLPEGKSDESFVYDGPGLDPAKKYKVYIFGHYRKSEYDPDYISILFSVPEFWFKTTSQAISFLGLLKALFLTHFDFFR